jgi:hypothetical protein
MKILCMCTFNRVSGEGVYRYATSMLHIYTYAGWHATQYLSKLQAAFSTLNLLCKKVLFQMFPFHA